MAALIPFDKLHTLILFVRGHRVIIDSDLARLYGVATKNLNKAVKRNSGRFPVDFMFELTKEEYQSLRFQIGTLKRGRHVKYLPKVFTQEGVAMLSGVLNSSRAINVNVEIMRAFVRLREIVSSHKELAKKIDDLERKVEHHDLQMREIFEAIRSLMSLPPKHKKPIGFKCA